MHQASRRGAAFLVIVVCDGNGQLCAGGSHERADRSAGPLASVRRMLRTILAGMSRSLDARNVALVYEPECAIVASLADVIDRSWAKPGTKVLVADCGGGTLDLSVLQVQRVEPFAFAEGAFASAGASTVPRCLLPHPASHAS